MGLRHLPVIDLDNRVNGMLTRANFSKEVLHRWRTKPLNPKPYTPNHKP